MRVRVPAPLRGPLEAAGIPFAGPATQRGARGTGLVDRVSAAALPVLGVLAAPLVVTGYVGLTLLALPWLSPRSLRRTRLL